MAEPLLYFYASSGALVLWGKLGKSGREIYGLSDILKRFMPDNARQVIEPIVFIALGAFISIGMVNPDTPAQAVAAGLGWTGLASKG